MIGTVTTSQNICPARQASSPLEHACHSVLPKVSGVILLFLCEVLINAKIQPFWGEGCSEGGRRGRRPGGEKEERNFSTISNDEKGHGPGSVSLRTRKRRKEGKRRLRKPSLKVSTKEGSLEVRQGVVSEQIRSKELHTTFTHKGNESADRKWSESTSSELRIQSRL